MKTQIRTTREHSAGFTLVELMVAVAIMGVFLSVAVTNLARKTPNQHRENAQWQIAGDLRLARQQALSQNTEVQVTFNNAENSYRIWVDSDRDGLKDPQETITRTLSQHKGANVWASPATATFTPQGNMKTAQAYLYISLFVRDSSGYKYLYVFENGHIDPDGAS